MNNHFYYIKIDNRGASALVTHYNDEKKQMRVEMICLKIRLGLAREKLQKAWDQYGATNGQVLQASNEFDALFNEYQHLIKELGPLGENLEN